MHQAEQDHADGGQRCPSVGTQQNAQRLNGFVFRQGGRAHVPHHHNGNYRFVGGESQNKGQENHSVHTEDPSHGIQYSRQAGKDGSTAQLDVRQKPNNDPGRGSHSHCPPQHENRAIQYGADDHRSHVRPSVRRQFQGEGGGSPPQNGAGQQIGHGQRHRYGEDYGGGQECRSPEGSTDARRSCKKQGGHGDEERESPVTGDKIVGQYGDLSLSFRINDAASHHTGGIAAESHTHGEGNFRCFLLLLLHIQ